MTGKRVAVVRNHAIQEWLRQDHPDIQLVPVATTVDALKLVADHQADALVDNLVTATASLTARS